MLLMAAIMLVLFSVDIAQSADRFEQCRQKLIQAQKLDVLHDLDWKPGKMPKVVVGPTFAQLPFETKQAFAETVNCFLMGGEAKYIQFDVMEYLNHRVVGTWSLGRFKAKE